MARWLSVSVLAVIVGSTPVHAEDLSSRLEQLERESAARPAPDPEPEPASARPASSSAPAAEPPAPAAPADPGPTPGPAAGRFGEIQERRARGYREAAAAAGRRVAKYEQRAKDDPALREQVRADAAERDLNARKADDVFKSGTEEYRAAYDEWLASEATPPTGEAEPEP